MRLSQVVRLSKYRLRSIARSMNDDGLKDVIFMGMSDLYNRFNLLTKSELVHTSKYVPLYELRAEDVLMLLSVMDADGNELQRSDVLDSRVWQWKQVNYRSFMLHVPVDGVVYAAYRASPPEFEGENPRIELPDAFLEALYLYVAYCVNSTVTTVASVQGRKGATESDVFRKYYEEECARLIMQGYSINLETERPAIQVKGYV